MSITSSIFPSITNSITSSILGLADNVVQKWTFSYNGIDAHGVLDEPWVTSGSNWEVEVVSYLGGNTGTNMYLLDNVGGGSTRGYLLQNTLLKVQYASQLRGGNNTANGNVVLQGGQAPDGLVRWLILPNQSDLSPIAIQVIGAAFNFSANWLGQIQNIKLTDLDNPANSIVIDNVISSATQPTNFNVYNELDGSIIGEYFNSVYELVEV